MRVLRFVERSDCWVPKARGVANLGCRAPDHQRLCVILGSALDLCYLLAKPAYHYKMRPYFGTYERIRSMSCQNMV